MHSTAQGARTWRHLIRLAGVGLLLAALMPPATAEVILQLFNCTWNEIAEKIPELAEVGYGSLWLPPPQKASGGLSVGYDLFDPFDLGSKDQRDSVKTRYGTEAELLRLIETAHRFGLRVYFDNIMNHRAFDVPGWDENTPVDIYPGMLPEDFHLRVTEDGFYRKWDNTVNWGSTWEVQNRNLADLIDIAHETPNANFGPYEGATHPKISFVRHPNNPEYYDWMPVATGAAYVGFYSTNITTNVIAQNQDFYKEDVGAYLCRSVRWLVDRTKVDGLRLDAVKHVPSWFFGDQNPATKDPSSAGYCGQAQWQFNITRGFIDWDNHRDTVFNVEASYGRNDLMMFGEHMGEPPSYNEYWDAGMRLLDARSKQSLNDKLGNPGNGLWGLDSADYVPELQMGRYLGVYYSKSHDDNISFRDELHNAINLTRAGLPCIYSDGNRHAETLGQSGGAFPRHANTAYLGQWGDNRIPNLVYIHNQFARGYQRSVWADGDYLAYERIDKRENSGMSNADGCTMLVLINDNYSSGQSRDIRSNISFPHQGGTTNDAYLYNYSSYGGGFYTYASALHNVIVPPGGYFVFSWRNPEESDLWKGGGGKPITIYEANGREAGWVGYVRRDGPDGDANFNPYGVPATQRTAYAYTWYVPRVTSPTNLRFVARVDGSAIDVLMKLDGGINLNNVNHASGDPRDYPPGNEGSYDVFLGYEQAAFVSRVGPEKFAAADSARNKIGSAGAETFVVTVGSGITTNRSDGSNDWSGAQTATWIWFNPNATDEWNNAKMAPAPGSMSTQVTLRVKVGYQHLINRLCVYYTTDGQTWPEGAGGQPIGSTRVAQMSWYADGAPDGQGTPTWWTTTITGLTNGMSFRFKIGGYRLQGSDGMPWYVPFPRGATEVALKTKMMGTWQVTNIHPATLVYRPHNDWGMTATGLVDGFHVIRARAFLERTGKASIYNTFVQPFYLDLQTPGGAIVYPAAGDTYWQNQYGVVVRTDPTVTEVLYNFADGNPANDDAQTGQSYGNGTNAAGQTAWGRAYKVTPSLSISNAYPDEWRFTYHNIPTNGSCVLRVRLREISSSTNMSLSAAQGHFTELARTNNTRAPAVTFEFGWPTSDGTVVEEGWDVWLRFSSSLGHGFSDAQMLERFLITINDVAQGRDKYRLTRDAGGGIGTLYYRLPGLYNGDTNFLHRIAITYLTGGGVTLQAHRYVRARSAYAGPVVQIVDPPEYDSDGKPYVITLPDVAVPSSTQRQYKIRVETDLSARHTWIAFTNSVGYTYRLPSTTNQLTGTVSVVQGSNLVTGSGTRFDVELGTGSRVLVSTNLVTVQQVLASNSLVLTGGYPGTTATGLVAYRMDLNPTTSGSKQYWEFLWTNMTEGYFTFVANVNTAGASEAYVHASQTRNTRVVFRQMVNSDTNDLDDDDDGLYDTPETSSTNLPSTNPETWNNGEVHIWYIFGRTDPLMPDTDGDGLPDGLESGWGTAFSATDTNTDTNGDGWPNFIADTDPPVFNTTDNSWHRQYNFYRSRTDLIGGSMTDPNNPDTDYDTLTDAREDLNRNGRVDIGLLSGGSVTGLLTHPNIPTIYNTSKVDLNLLPTNARLLETDPNRGDTDGDGAGDGREDANANARVDLALLYPAGTTTPFVVTWQTNAQYLLGTNVSRIRSRRLNYAKLWTDFPRPTYTNGTWYNTNTWPRLLLLETDPLEADSNGDGLPDGWKIRYGLDPLDNGWYNLRTGQMHVTNSQQGADGDLTGDGINNLQHYLNGTDPRVTVTAAPPAGAITIGRGSAIGTIGGVTYYEEFMDWAWSDLRALDYYEGAGPNNQQGDVYRTWDGWDSSRDLVAFYTRDGGALPAGTGRFYFRVDCHDLRARAEEGNLDIYVVIDTGNPNVGERVLPDEVDTLTDMRWEIVVGLYESGLGSVYVDTNPAQNTSAFGQDLFSYGGVQAKPGYFISAYYNHELDAIEFAIDRQALLDVNWNGNPASLNFQVFATKDGTCNSCNGGKPGAGDIGGRSDIRDSIYNDYIAEDYWEAQSGLAGANSVLRGWIPGSHQASRAKVALLVHGNQALQPGSVIQNLVNDGAGAGYYRALLAHEVFRQPLNLHVTPTLAMAIEWARVDTNVSPWWRDGPSLNRWIARLAASNIVYMLASTFSDHMLPYFTKEFNRDNVRLAEEVLGRLYGVTFTTNSVFWTPERLLDADVFDKIRDLGYRWTVLDQNTHLWWWFGRTDSLGENGYSINRIHGVHCFVINNHPSSYRFSNDDNGLDLVLRGLFNRRARGSWERLTTFFSNWEDFGRGADAAAYDLNLRWMANRPWIRVVGFEEITKAELDLGGGYKSWSNGIVQRGSPTLAKRSHDWIDHATRSNYDNWYLGYSLAEGLQGKIFQIRPGTNLPKAYGMMYTAGLITDTWARVHGIADTNLAWLARSVLHASVFQTAFHNNDEHNLSRWSTGEYIYPTSKSNTMARFAEIAQAQTRMAAIYAYVDGWAAAAGSWTTTLVAQADVDLDGEPEYVLANNRLLGLFERIGGRMVGAWVRHGSHGPIYQVAGNHVGYAGSVTEEEGAWNAESNGTVVAHRTSCFKDWWAGTPNYVNALYTFTATNNGWVIASTNNRIRKTITLAPQTNRFEAEYVVDPTLNGGVLYVRHGLSPNLYDLLLRGQATLGSEVHTGGVMVLANSSSGMTVRAEIGYADAGHNTGFNTNAVDDDPGKGVTFYTINMRNQVQTHQVELVGTNTFRFSLGFSTAPSLSEWEQWCQHYGYNPNDYEADADGDGLSNWGEFVAGTDPEDGQDFFCVGGTARVDSGIRLSFDTASGRRYYIWYSNASLLNPAWSNATPSGLWGTGDTVNWTDDGSQTAPPPSQVTNRFYRLEVERP